MRSLSITMRMPSPNCASRRANELPMRDAQRQHRLPEEAAVGFLEIRVSVRQRARYVPQAVRQRAAVPAPTRESIPHQRGSRPRRDCRSSAIGRRSARVPLDAHGHAQKYTIARRGIRVPHHSFSSSSRRWCCDQFQSARKRAPELVEIAGHGVVIGGLCLLSRSRVTLPSVRAKLPSVWALCSPSLRGGVLRWWATTMTSISDSSSSIAREIRSIGSEPLAGGGHRHTRPRCA